MDIFEQWERGDIEDLAALRSLASDLGEVESELTPLEEQRKAIRARIERVVSHLGGKAKAAGFEMTISQASQRVSYDTKMLDSLLAKLSTQGMFAIAEELAAARKETTVAGSLRVTKEKAGKA